MLKKIVIVALAALALTALMSGVAFANFGPHGGYAENTDACAGCHRAHTSVSSVTWNDNSGTMTDQDKGTSHSALLVSNATKMSDFCYACHGESAPGAATNVYSGIFDSGPSADKTDNNGGGSILYHTSSEFGKPLNGGGFVQMPTATGFTSVSSAHDMDLNPNNPAVKNIPMWGAGSSLAMVPNLTCTDCHDPHGSSNYRLLKDQVNGVKVGGYDDAGNPTPYVISDEIGYPNGQGGRGLGWKKHQDGKLQMDGYQPDYTSPEYGYMAPGTDANGTANVFKSMSIWCSACHTDYGDPNQGGWGTTAGSSANYQWAEQSKNGSANPNDPAAQLGGKGRHRHPVDVTLQAGSPDNSDRSLTVAVKTDDRLPLERVVGTGRQGASNNWTYTDYLGCLTCHRAHGVETTMTGWASASLTTTSNANAPVNWMPVPDPSRNGGVNPSGNTTAAPAGVNTPGTSSLLRLDNRGVCEVCHQK